MLYRIVTGRKNKPAVAAIVAGAFPDFTLLDGEGYWKQKHEASLIVEIETNDEEKVIHAAAAIKRRNDQEAVMVQRIPNHAWLV